MIQFEWPRVIHPLVSSTFGVHCRVSFSLDAGKGKWVLLVNVGPIIFRNLSEMYLKTVRNVSVTKNCQNSTWNVSDMCLKSVRFRILSEICQTKFGNVSEKCWKSKMCQKSIILFHKKLSEFCHKRTNWHIFDTYLDKSWNIFMKHLQLKSVGKLSTNRFLTLIWSTVETFPWNICQKMCQKTVKLQLLTHFISDSYLSVILDLSFSSEI